MITFASSFTMGEGTFPKTQRYPHPWIHMLRVPLHGAQRYPHPWVHMLRVPLHGALSCNNKQKAI